MSDKTLEPGSYQMPDAEYFALDAVSHSDLKQVMRSPAHYRAYKDNPDDTKDTPAKLTGRALHCTVLEPGEFFNRYAVLPPDAPPRPTKAQMNAANPTELAIDRINFYHEFEARAAGKTVITSDQSDNYLQIGETIRNHPELAKLLNGGMAERAVLANDPETGLMCRCKTDFAVKAADLRVVIDLKSAEDARPRVFSRNAFNYGYFTQAAFYRDIWGWLGYPIDLWLFAVFEKEPPYAVKLYEVQEADLERGRVIYRQALNTLAECMKTDEWPAYSTDIEPLRYPEWAK